MDQRGYIAARVTTADPRYPLTLVQVQTPAWSAKPFCAGAVFRGPVCIEAAPIIRWMVGKSWLDVQRVCRTKRWRAVVVTARQPD